MTFTAKRWPIQTRQGLARNRDLCEPCQAVLVHFALSEASQPAHIAKNGPNHLALGILEGKNRLDNSHPNCVLTFSLFKGGWSDTRQSFTQTFSFSHGQLVQPTSDTLCWHQHCCIKAQSAAAWQRMRLEGWCNTSYYSPESEDREMRGSKKLPCTGQALSCCSEKSAPIHVHHTQTPDTTTPPPLPFLTLRVDTCTHTHTHTRTHTAGTSSVLLRETISSDLVNGCVFSSNNALYPF